MKTRIFLLLPLTLAACDTKADADAAASLAAGNAINCIAGDSGRREQVLSALP